MLEQAQPQWPQWPQCKARLTDTTGHPSKGEGSEYDNPNADAKVVVSYEGKVRATGEVLWKDEKIELTVDDPPPTPAGAMELPQGFWKALKDMARCNLPRLAKTGYKGVGL